MVLYGYCSGRRRPRPRRGLLVRTVRARGRVCSHNGLVPPSHVCSGKCVPVRAYACVRVFLCACVQPRGDGCVSVATCECCDTCVICATGATGATGVTCGLRLPGAPAAGTTRACAASASASARAAARTKARSDPTGARLRPVTCRRRSGVSGWHAWDGDGEYVPHWQPYSAATSAAATGARLRADRRASVRVGRAEHDALVLEQLAVVERRPLLQPRRPLRTRRGGAGMHRDRAGLATVLLLLLLLLLLVLLILVLLLPVLLLLLLVERLLLAHGRPPKSPAVHLLVLRGPVSCVACLRRLWLQAGGRRARLGRRRRRRPTAGAGVLGSSRVPQQGRV